MERIQSAIEKARAKRGTQETSVRPRPGQERPRQPAANRTGDAWGALETFEPSVAHLHRNRILTLERNTESTHFDMLRTKILQRMKDNSWVRLAITSPDSSCGKTTTSLNLAFSLARQAETRVMLIEMDLRRPAMARLLGLRPGQQQLSEALAGRAPLERHLLRIGENLAIGTNSDAVRRAPSELLQSNSMRQCLDTMQSDYNPDIILFDMPPMLVSDDMRGFADNIDSALLIAAAESSTMDQVDGCESELAERTNVMGIVLNKCRYMGKEYGYSYYG